MFYGKVGKEKKDLEKIIKNIIRIQIYIIRSRSLFKLIFFAFKYKNSFNQINCSHKILSQW